MLLRQGCWQPPGRLALFRPVTQRRGAVAISANRLDEFLKAEVQYLGNETYASLGLHAVLANTKPERVAQLILREVPPRMATRIVQIESITPDWQSIPELVVCRHQCFKSFSRLRMVDLHTSSLTAFTEVIRDLRARHRPLGPQYTRVAQKLKEQGIRDDAAIDEWVGNVMRSRMSTEMLTAHFMTLLTDPDQNHVGIVDTKCDPARICEVAVHKVQNQFPDSGVNISLRVEQPDIEFSFISKYLLFILEELLRNSVCATLSRTESTGEPPRDINVLVCEDPRLICIRISDEGGGVPVEHLDRIWEYMFTTTPARLQLSCNTSSPLAGPGMGLPLCRLYAQYLGGSLHLMSMPRVGTDVYLYLNRIDVQGPHCTEAAAEEPSAQGNDLYWEPEDYWVKNAG